MLTELQKHIASYNTDTELLFDEPSHRYYNEADKTYKSVTQFLGDFEKPFDKH